MLGFAALWCGSFGVDTVVIGGGGSVSLLGGDSLALRGYSILQNGSGSHVALASYKPQHLIIIDTGNLLKLSPR